MNIQNLIKFKDILFHGSETEYIHIDLITRTNPQAQNMSSRFIIVHDMKDSPR